MSITAETSEDIKNAVRSELLSVRTNQTGTGANAKVEFVVDDDTVHILVSKKMAFDLLGSLGNQMNYSSNNISSSMPEYKKC